MIPKVLHFIWITVGEPMPESLKIGLLTAKANTTMKIILHTNDRSLEPTEGIEYRYREFNLSIKNITMEEAGDMTYKGSRASRLSHIKDIYRLEILYEEGGIYSDLDVLWLRNPWEFWEEKVVIGYSNKSYHILCNAVMMAEARQEAIKIYKDWLIDIYPCKKYWIPANPYKLWKDKKEICMIDKYYFFPISWEKCKDIPYEKIQKSICVHYFASMADCSGSVVEKLKNIIR